MGYRYYFNKKSTVEEYSKTITTSFLNKYDYFIDSNTRSGTLSWTRNNEPNGSIGIEVNVNNTTSTGYLRVHFTQTDRQTGEKKDFDYRIQLTATRCNYGGLKWWFLDPCSQSPLRCAKLYLQSNGYFASRKLLNLTYEQRNESKYFRVLRHIFGQEGTESEKLYASIKYPYRNGKATRKMRKYLKMTQTPYTLEEQHRLEMKYLLR